MKLRHRHIETREASIPATEIIEALLCLYRGKLGGESYELEAGKKILVVTRHTSHAWDERIRELSEEESDTIDALLHLKDVLGDM